MCYTKEASIGAFLTGIISSIALITLGNERYKKENLLFGLLFIWVSFMQLIDYLIYIDPKCKVGSNRLAGLAGPLIVAFQPTIVFILYLIIIQPGQDSFYSKYKNLFIGLNAIYVLIVLGFYTDYVKNSSQCSIETKGRPSWSWSLTKFNFVFEYWLYIGMLMINVLLLIQSAPITIIGIIFLFLLFFVARYSYKYHLGEFWCFFANSVPLFILIVEKLFL
jgi:hypothetical protein